MQTLLIIGKFRQCLCCGAGMGLSALVLNAAAQQSTFSYDPAGNTVAVTNNGNAAPLIGTQPQPQLIESNAPVTLSVLASGIGLSYQWFSNGVPMIGANGASLVLNNLAVTNYQNFTVVVSNPSGSVTSAWIALWADSNGNGIPDWWELQYFGNLNQNAAGDFDGDGVNNLDEYLEGTDTTNPKSYNPRLHLASAGGKNVASPDLPYYTLGQLVTLTAIPDNSQNGVTWSGSVSGNKPIISLVMDGRIRQSAQVSASRCQVR